MKKCWDLFSAFFRAGNYAFGGGMAMIPLIQHETVNIYKWLSEEEFADIVAISSVLPAPLITKMAGMIGHRVSGWLGVLAAEIGVFLPSALAVILLGGLIGRFAETTVLKGMLIGVRPVVIVLLLQAAWSVGKQAFVDRLMWVFGAVALCVLLFVPWIHPAFLVAAAMVLGYVFCRKGWRK
ncbi:MAG: chromate transporter [Peptococcaceae bacterium]|nr:chromate transporter [Peptococcaceae bacterium]